MIMSRQRMSSPCVAKKCSHAEVQDWCDPLGLDSLTCVAGIQGMAFGTTALDSGLLF